MASESTPSSEDFPQFQYDIYSCLNVTPGPGRETIRLGLRLTMPDALWLVNSGDLSEKRSTGGSYFSTWNIVVQPLVHGDHDHCKPLILLKHWESGPQFQIPLSLSKWNELRNLIISTIPHLHSPELCGWGTREFWNDVGSMSVIPT